MKHLFNLINLLLLIILIAGFASCNKNDFFSGDDTLQEVEFSSRVITGGNKSVSHYKVVTGVDYALIEIDSIDYRPAVFMLDGIIYTKAIKLIPGSYFLNKFLMMNDNGTPDDYSDDIIMLAAPMEGSPFSVFVDKSAGFSFGVDNFKKANVDIDIIYFNPSDYSNFGFDFDVLPSTTVREQTFTGLFNTCYPADFINSLYEDQDGGLQYQMNAIYKIDVYQNSRYVKSFDNATTHGNSNVTVQYPDGDNSNDDFHFELMLYGQTESGFGYKHVYSWDFTDDELIPFGSDSLVHFEIGGNSTGTNVFELGPDIKLPKTITYTVATQWGPGTLNAYFDAMLSEVPLGTSIGNGLYRSWCGTDSVSINIQHHYEMDVISSLNTVDLPLYTRNATRWNKINWLFNHLDRFPGYQWYELQGAVWVILNDWDGVAFDAVPDKDLVVDSMVLEANSNPNYLPGCGEKAAVIFIPKNTPKNSSIPRVQVTFIIINL